MKTILTKIAILAVLLLPNVSQADLLSCGVHSINTIYIQGDRDDNNPHANNVIVSIDGATCNGNNLIYIENTSANYNAFLSGLMTAYASGMKIGIYVNTSKTIPGATQISLINLVK